MTFKSRVISSFINYPGAEWLDFLNKDLTGIITSIFMKFICIVTLLFSIFPLVTQTAGFMTPDDISTHEQERIEINGVLNTTAFDNFTYIGISPRMSTRKKEIEQAKIHIANQIAMNRSCNIDYGFVSNFNNDFYRDAKDSNLDYQNDRTEEICEELEVVFCRHFSELTVVAARYKEVAADIDFKLTRNNSERPWWFYKVPEIVGWYVGVGISDPYSVPYRAMIVADINAAQQIAMEKNSFFWAWSSDKIKELRKNSILFGLSELYSGDLILSFAELQGLYIIDRWMEPDGSCFYSLAIARK